MEKPFTVRDIAEKAGVSLGTVSRVLNNAANIDPKLREQTLAVIRANHYVPLRRPRRSSRRNPAEGGRIGVLFYDTRNGWKDSYFARSYAAGIEAVCGAYRAETQFFTLEDLGGDAFFSGGWRGLTGFSSSTISARTIRDAKDSMRWRR